MLAHLKYPRIWKLLIIAAAITVTIVVIGVLISVLVFPPAQQAKENGHQPISKSHVTTTDATSLMRRAFGPWTLVKGGVPSARILLLHPNGSLEAGSKIIRPNAQWQPTVVSEFRDVTRHHGYAEVRTTTDQIFQVDYRQAFVMEDRPEMVFAFRANGSIVSNPTSSYYKKEK